MSTKKKWAWIESGRRISGTGLSEMLLRLEGDKGVDVGTIGYNAPHFLRSLSHDPKISHVVDRTFFVFDYDGGMRRVEDY